MIALKAASNRHCPIIKTACLGDKCMMWRWATVKQLANAIDERVALDDGIGIDAKQFVNDWGNNTRPPEGYCGLAGVPSCAA